MSSQNENGPPKSAEKSSDVVLVHGVTEDKKGLRVLRARNDAVELGEVRPLKEGQPITNDVVRLHPRKEAPYLCDVETTYVAADKAAGPPEPAACSSAPRGAPGPRVGPAQVATQAYRDNWDAIWAGRVSSPGSSELN